MKLFDIPDIKTEAQQKRLKQRCFWLKMGWLLFLVFGIALSLSGIFIFISKLNDKFHTDAVVMLIFGLIALALFAVTYVIFYRKRLGIKNYGSNYTNAIKREGDE